MNQKSIEVQSNSQGIIVHALHKSASMFLYRLFKNLANEKEIYFYSKNNQPSNRKEIDENIEDSFCLGPERNFNINQYHFNKIDRVTHVFQVRDPRDILVSQYFSFGWLHKLKAGDDKTERELIQSISIDEYVLKAATDSTLHNLLDRYTPILEISRSNAPNAVIVRYEDMVLRFKDWLPKIIDVFDFHPVRSRVLLAKYLFKYRHSFKPPKTEAQAHKRKITPGDHKDKLKAGTIEELNHIFADILREYNYID